MSVCPVSGAANSVLLVGVVSASYPTIIFPFVISEKYVGKIL